MSSQHSSRPDSPVAAAIITYCPGVVLCLLAAAISFGISQFVPSLSALVVAIILGIVVTNAINLPASFAAGIDFSAKKLLRVGIVFLGLQLVLSDIAALGIPMLLTVIVIVAGGLLGTVFIGRLLKISSTLTLLIACGFSICGAAAVAGASGVVDPDGEAEEDTVTAVALVVIFGTLMIALMPLLVSLLGMDDHSGGMWVGGSVHEIAQVVVAGGIISSSALTVAVIVKLARVLLLAPVVAGLSIRQRRLLKKQGQGGAEMTLPPIVPLFVVGFLLMVLIRSFVPVPVPVLTVGKIAQTALLSAAMFGLGCGVKVRKLIHVGLKPFVLAALSTIGVTLIAYIGVLLSA